MAEDVELKPCPFCGSEPKLKSDVRHGGDAKNTVGVHYYWIKCPNDYCRVASMSVDSREMAAELWNRRG